MKELRFLDLDEMLEIHSDQIRRYGGSDGLRDLGLLRSAMAMASAKFGDRYLHADVFEMAAAYLFQIAQNHPFIDGNKRTAVAAADVFLQLNGHRIKTNILHDFESLVRRVASGAASKADIADNFRSC